MYKFFFDLNLQVKKLVINSILEFPRELARRIEAICGTKSLEIYQSKISENLPEVFEPDAEFYPLTVIYGDLTATVNSFYECGVYVEGGWGTGKYASFITDYQYLDLNTTAPLLLIALLIFIVIYALVFSASKKKMNK